MGCVQFAAFFGHVPQFAVSPDAVNPDQSRHIWIPTNAGAFAPAGKQILHLRLSGNDARANRLAGKLGSFGSTQRKIAKSMRPLFAPAGLVADLSHLQHHPLRKLYDIECGRRGNQGEANRFTAARKGARRNGNLSLRRALSLERVVDRNKKRRKDDRAPVAFRGALDRNGRRASRRAHLSRRHCGHDLRLRDAPSAEPLLQIGGYPPAPSSCGGDVPEIPSSAGKLDWGITGDCLGRQARAGANLCCARGRLCGEKRSKDARRNSKHHESYAGKGRHVEVQHVVWSVC